MSMSAFLWSTARGLRLQVRPAVADNNEARDTIDNGIRVLTAVANALDAQAGLPLPEALAGAGAGKPADTDRLPGPAENLAAYRDTGAAIAELAATVAASNDAAFPADIREAIAWEKTMLDAGVARFDAAERAVPAATVDSVASIDPQALQAYLRTWSGNADLTVEGFRLIVGGRSRQTALFALANAPGLPTALVVQRGIPGQVVSPFFVGEVGQFRLLEALHGAGMRVPKPILVEEDPAPLGAAFLIVERSAGSPVLTDYWLPVESENVVLDLAREMALLHSQPTEAIAPMLVKARDSYDIAGWQAELERLASDWNDLAFWPSVTMSAVIRWLRANVDCLDDRQTIVHNDMVFHNILGEDDRITAVLDWEQASIGHPGEDLGYCLPYVIPTTDWDKFMGVYREAGGPAVTQRQIDYFALRAGLRLMTLVIRGGRDSFVNGLATDVLVASAGAHFTQRLLHRISGVLQAVLARTA